MRAETIGVAALALCGSVVGAPSYRVVDLGSAGGASRAFALSENGWTAGVTAVSAGNAHVGWGRAPGGALTTTGSLSGDALSWAFAVTGSGEAYGVSFSLGQVAARSFRWSGGGSPVDIGLFSARGVNGSGVVVGHVSVASGMSVVDRGCVLEGGALTELPGLGGANWYARAVNASGRIAGMSWTTGENAHRAVVWQGGVVKDLGTLGGASSQALGLNEGDRVVGWAQVASGDPHACVFVVDAGGNVTSRVDLGTLAGARSSTARGVNNRGQVVGVSDGRPFFWRQGGGMVDLNTRIEGGAWELHDMYAVNDAGQIAGYGELNGFPRAVLLMACEGDANGDFQVNFADLNIVLSHFGAGVPAGEMGDFNNDGVVTFADLNVLLGRFGQGC